MLWESRKANQLLYEKLLNPQGRTGLCWRRVRITVSHELEQCVCACARPLSVKHTVYEVIECLPPFDWPNSIFFTVNRIMIIMELKVKLQFDCIVTAHTVTMHYW